MLPLLLNLDANKSNPYAATLSGLRHSAREGGVDGQGGHNNRRASNYHFHRGPLDGRTHASKEDATKALSAYSPGVANEAATDSSRSTERPLFDLTPYRPY